MKTILVTGGAGFIGSNYIKQKLKKEENIKIVNIDLLTYAGNLKNLVDIKNDLNCTFVKGDICDEKLIGRLFEKYNFDVIINFAAESNVDRSIENPHIFFDTNVKGTLNLINTAKRYWNLNPDDKYSTDYKKGVKFLQVSTDEVYGDLGKTGLFKEITPVAPNNPYSASKASADLLVYSYFATYNFPINITRCSNNYGPYQFPEKLIPLMINNCIKENPLPLYGDGMQIRDWLHVYDHCSGIDSVIEKGVLGQVYNIGGNNEKTNIEIIKLIINELGKSEDLIKHVKDRLGHDRRYAIDNTKITTELGWTPSYTFEEGIKETIEWYLNNQDWMKSIISGEYKNYNNNMYNSFT